LPSILESDANRRSDGGRGGEEETAGEGAEDRAEGKTMVDRHLHAGPWPPAAGGQSPASPDRRGRGLGCSATYSASFSPTRGSEVGRSTAIGEGGTDRTRLLAELERDGEWEDGLEVAGQL
jgi:hypothetical protein